MSSYNDKILPHADMIMHLRSGMRIGISKKMASQIKDAIANNFSDFSQPFFVCFTDEENEVEMILNLSEIICIIPN